MIDLYTEMWLITMGWTLLHVYEKGSVANMKSYRYIYQKQNNSNLIAKPRKN